MKGIKNSQESIVNMEQNTSTKKPLVSIVITLYNGEKLISCALESALNQTYSNIEVVVFDDASTDNTEAIVRKYAKADPRVVYVRNDSNIGYARSLAKLPEIASGEYAQLLGADDWIADNCVETLVECMEDNPNAACITPEMITLEEMPDNRFQFLNKYIPKKKRPSKKFYIRNVYKTELGSTLTPYALFRKDDFLESASFIKDALTNPPVPTPKEMLEVHSRGHATGTLFLLKVMHKYEYLIFTDKTVYIKTQNSKNKTKAYNSIIDWVSAGRILQSYYFDRIGYDYLFKSTYRKFRKGLRLFFSVEPFISIFFVFIKRGCKPKFFADLKWKDIKAYFADYSFAGRIMALLYLPIRLGIRTISFGTRIFSVPRTQKKDVFKEEYFLNKKGYFSVPKIRS